MFGTGGPFGRLWYVEPNAISNAIGYAKFYSRSHNVVIRVYDEAGNVIETHEHAGGEFKQFLRLPEPWHSAIAETGKRIAGRALLLINLFGYRRRPGSRLKSR